MKTREKLLKSALKLFAKQGINRTSTSQITKDAGVAEGTLFVHFKTKQELIDTLYLGIKKRVFPSLIEKLKFKYSAEQYVGIVSEHLINHYTKNYSEFIFIELVEMDPQLSDAAFEAGEKEYEPILRSMGKFQREGVLKNVDLAIILKMAWGILSAVIKAYKAQKVREIDPNHIKVIWDAIKK